MRELYLKRNELNEISQNLRSAKFDLNLTKEQVKHLVEEQQKVYDKYKFYDNFIKIGGKIYGKEVRSKER